jgi:2-polyprenyl-6-methoxyphenol hydroxylase-like FAD-dependent oxidoreductase
MRERSMSKALIIGGGIGGLCAAIALRQAGMDVTVFERVTEMHEVGAGLTLWTNAVRALQKLGLTDALQAIGAPGTRGSIRSWQGEILSAIPVDELTQEFGVVPLAVHRADLQAVLLSALGEGVVHLGASCVGCTQDETGVRAQFADGQEAQGEVLIGADGLHSVIRAHLFGQTKPRYAGYTAWRSVTPFQVEQQGEAFETWGRGKRFGFVPLNQGRVYWFATRNMPEGRGDGKMGRKGEVLDLFRGWHEPIEALIKTTEESAILRNDIYDQKPLHHWGEGRITLLGDAAHPMTPNMGQGACQAIEDAIVLAACLRNASDLEAALRAYEEERIKRTAAIVKRSWTIGRVAQWENLLACSIRNALLKRTPSGVLLKQLVWVVEYEA